MRDDIGSQTLIWWSPAVDSSIDWLAGTEWLVERRPSWREGDVVDFPPSDDELRELLTTIAGLDPNGDNPCTRGACVDDGTLTLDGSILGGLAGPLTIRSGGRLQICSADSAGQLTDSPPPHDCEGQENKCADGKRASPPGEPTTDSIPTMETP